MNSYLICFLIFSFNFLYAQKKEVEKFDIKLYNKLIKESCPENCDVKNFLQ